MSSRPMQARPSGTSTFRSNRSKQPRASRFLRSSFTSSARATGSWRALSISAPMSGCVSYRCSRRTRRGVENYPAKQIRLKGVPRGRRPAVSESEVAKDCKAELARRGYVVYRIQCGTWRTLRGNGFYTGAPIGTPDYVALHPAHPGFLLETKSSTGSLRVSQKFQHSVIRQGYRLAICTARDVWSLRNWLDQFEKGSTAPDKA